jgi:hypothetical protein
MEPSPRPRSEDAIRSLAPGILRFVGIAVIVTGCTLVDIAPSRSALDERWRTWMLTEHYAHWQNGKERTLQSSMGNQPLGTGISSYPRGAPFTTTGIAMTQELYNEGPGWDIQGGLIGRTAHAGTTIDLFGREVRRVHRFLFAYGFAPGRDFSYDFFLVIRPAYAPARVVREWHFPAKTLALSGDAIDQSLLGRSTRSRVDIEGFLHPAQGETPRHLIDGFLDFDPATKTVTVSISGLKQPFSARVDLSAELAR